MRKTLCITMLIGMMLGPGEADDISGDSLTSDNLIMDLSALGYTLNVSPATIQGKDLGSETIQPGQGIAFWGSYYDPDGDPVQITLNGPPRSKLEPPPDGNEYTVQWQSLETDEGDFAFVITATDIHGATDVGTFVVRVRRPVPNRPPAITHGGCKVFR